MHVHGHFYNLNMWLIMWVCSGEVETVLLTGCVLFVIPMMLNLERNNDMNNTRTCYKAIIQFTRLSITNEGKATLIKTHANLQTFIRFCWWNLKVVSRPSSQPYKEPNWLKSLHVTNIRVSNVLSVRRLLSGRKRNLHSKKSFNQYWWC